MFNKKLKPNSSKGQSFWKRTVLAGMAAAAVLWFGLVSVLAVPEARASAGWAAGKFSKTYDFNGQFYVDAGSVYNGVKSVAFWTKGTTYGGKVIDLNGTSYISISAAGVVSATGFTSPTIYIDGVVGTTVDANWHYVVVKTDTAINASAVKFGSVEASNLVGMLDDVKLFNYALSAREINEKYRQGSPSMAQGGMINDSSAYAALTITQSGAGKIVDLIGDSITTGTGLALSVDGLTTGTGLDITSTSTAGGASASSKMLNIARSGANTNASHTAYGLYSAVTNTGITSTNIAGYFSASGATNNYGLIVAAGNVGIGITTPSFPLHVAGQCVTADTKLRRRRKKKKGEKADEEAGEWEDDEYIYDEVMIKDIQPGDEIASMNPITGELIYSQVNGLMNMGIKPLYRLTTLSGRQIRTTENHPYFVRTKYEEDIKAKQNQKLYRFEVDQSVRFEEYTKDTIIAIANAENKFSAVIPRKIKRMLRDSLREYNPKKFTPAMFASSIVFALQQSELAIHELLIDIEYPGHEDIIAKIILSAFPQIEIDFVQVGKKSPAHYFAYDIYKNEKTADYAADIDGFAYNAENALRTVTHSHIRRTIRSPQAPLINNSINDNKNLVKGKRGVCNKAPQSRGTMEPTANLAKSGEWTLVKNLEKGQMIAVVHGNKIVWEKIVEIKQLPAERVYDIEVEGTHNFVANDIIAHNTYINANSAAALRVEQDGVKDDVLVVDTAAGNVGIGTAAPGSKLEISENAATSVLTVTQSGTGSIIDLKSSTTSLFTLNNEDRLTLDGTLLTTMGALNTNLIDDMESAADTEWVESDGVNTAVATETTKIKVNDGAMKITTTAGSSNTDYVRKTISSENWSSYGRIGFWIQATQTGQIASLQFYDTGAITSDYDITIKNANEWQYEEWDISGITSTSRDAVSWIQFIIDSDTSSPTFYIDQLRLYSASSATNRMAEYFLDADGKLVMFGDEGIELGRTTPGSSLPSMKIGAATVEIRNPLDLQVEGDVGVEYNLAFLNNDTSYITSAGPLIISGGDSNSYENLTITTSGTGDIIIDIADSSSGFKIVGTGGGIFTVDASGNVVIGGVNAVDADLTVKRNIATQGGNITVAKLSTPANITVTPVGTAGTTTYGYRISAINGNGETLASATVTTATGNATLSATNYNSVAWDAVAGATGYKVYGRTSGAELYMATVSSPALIYNDDGSVVTPAGALPSANTAGGDITGILSFSNATNLTLSSDAVTVTQTYHTVDEEGAAIDDLSTINGGTAGDILVLRGYDTDFAVTAKDGIGNLKLTADFVFTAVQDTLTLIFDGTNWLEVSRSTNGADIAESYYASDLSIKDGDIVAISSTNGIEKIEDKPNYFIEKTSKPYDSKLLGIISTNPFMTMGGGYGKITDKNGNIKAETRSVALAGRAPAKVSLENGNIEIGDFLTSSSAPGVAMRAAGSGRVVGRALEPFDGNVTECSVEVVEIQDSESYKDSESGTEESRAESRKKPETLRMTNCRKVPSEIGKVMTFIELGWQSGENQSQNLKTEWLEMNSWCVSVDENGEWKKVKKTAETCKKSAESAPLPISAPISTPTPEPEPEPTPVP